MLDAGRAPEHRAGLIVFFDHADENRRYVVAETPRLAGQPDPQLSLLLFRSNEAGDRTSGGLLQLEAALAPSMEQLEKVREELVSLGREPVLAAPDWRSGSVEVAGWLAVSDMAPLSLALGPPSLTGDPFVALAARLDQQGAALAAESLRGDALPVVLLWKLETLGLGGPLGIKVEADLQAMHKRLTLEGALNVPIGRARLAKTWERFASEQLIRTRIIDESGDVDGNRGEAMRRVGEDLTARMFSPFPPPEAAQLLKDDPVAAVELSFRLTHRREELEQTRHWSFHERSAVAITHYAAAGLVGLLHGRPLSKHIFFADLGAQTREVVVRVEPELDALAIAALEVDLEWTRRGEPDRVIAFSPAVTEERFTVDRDLSTAFRYRVRARFDASKTRALDQQTDWMEAPGDLVVVSARRLFPPRSLTLMIGRAEMDWIDSVKVDVRAPLEPERSIVLSPDRRSATAFFPGAGKGLLHISASWIGAAGEPERTAEAFDTDEELVILDSPFGDSINVLAVPLPLGGVVNVALELEHATGDLRRTLQLNWDGDDRSSRTAALRRLPETSRRYRYRVLLMHEDGTLDEQPWVETEKGTIVIGAEKPVKVYATEAVALGGGPAERGSFAIEFVLQSGPDRTSALLEGEAANARLVLVTAENASEPRLHAREFLNSGQVVETHWETLEPLHVLGLPKLAEN